MQVNVNSMDEALRTQLSDMALWIDPEASWWLCEPHTEPEKRSHLLCVGWENSDAMAYMAHSCQAQHMLYAGFCDSGFLGQGQVMMGYWQVVSCRVDEVELCKTVWDRGGSAIPAKTKIFIGYARCREKDTVALTAIKRRVAYVPVIGSSF